MNFPHKMSRSPTPPLWQAAHGKPVTSWTCGGGSTVAAAGGTKGALEPHGTTTRLANAVFFSAYVRGKQDW